MQKLDILAFGAHPDDVELACSGTLLKAIASGQRVGIVDLTRGELGTRGSAELRDQEAEQSRLLMGVHVRENLRLADGLFESNETSLMTVIEAIRKFQPTVVLINAPKDRHPDHGRGAELCARACFLSGLPKIKTDAQAWRPDNVLHYIQDNFLDPDIVVDVSAFHDKKMEAIACFASQFYNPNSDEPETPISGEGFIHHITGRARQLGRLIGVEYGEGFIKTRPLAIDDLTLI